MKLENHSDGKVEMDYTLPDKSTINLTADTHNVDTLAEFVGDESVNSQQSSPIKTSTISVMIAGSIAVFIYLFTIVYFDGC
jgi:hypothetical protein